MGPLKVLRTVTNNIMEMPSLTTIFSEVDFTQLRELFVFRAATQVYELYQEAVPHPEYHLASSDLNASHYKSMKRDEVYGTAILQGIFENSATVYHANCSVSQNLQHEQV